MNNPKMKYFAYCSDGFELFETETEAVKLVNECLGYEREDAHEGWSDDVSSICVGTITMCATEIDREPAPDGSSLDCICDYKLLPVPSDPCTQGN